MTQTGEISASRLREFLLLTISTDHDVINGGPGARFAWRLKGIIENGVVLGQRPTSLKNRLC